MPQNMGVAINVNWFSFEGFSFKWPENYPYSMDGSVINIGFKIGGLYTYNPMPLMYFDGYFNLNPTYSVVGVSTSNSTYAYNSDLILVGTSMRTNIGGNFRYDRLLVGLDFNFGTTKNADNNAMVPVTSNFSSSYFRIRLGLVFTKR